MFSLPDEKHADVKLKELKELGYKAYKVQFMHPAFNKNWYRIRIGSFYEYKLADSIAGEIELKLKIKTWIDKEVRL